MSDFIPMAHEIGYDKMQIKDLLITLHIQADYRNVFRHLQTFGCGDLVFDIASSLSSRIKTADFVSLIVEAFKSAFRSMNYFTAFKLHD